MTAFWLTAYVLVWPVLAAGILAVLVVSLVRDWRAARESGDAMV